MLGEKKRKQWDRVEGVGVNDTQQLNDQEREKSERNGREIEEKREKNQRETGEKKKGNRREMEENRREIEEGWERTGNRTKS